MELNYLRVFYEVARVGKFREAAERLRISPSALSRSVALLEDMQKIQLFDRSQKGVVLTAKGEEVFRLCQHLFQVEKEIEDLCRGVQEKCDGPLRFAASDHVVNDYLIKDIHSFRQKFPRVVPQIRSGSPDEIISNLTSTKSEFALLFAKVPVPHVEFTRLVPEKMALVCNPRLWKENKSSSNEKTLQKVLHQTGYIASLGALLDARPNRVLRELFGDLPQVGLEVNSQESQKRFCIAGEGIAYLARFMVAKEISDGTLLEIPVASAHEFHLWLAKPKGKNLSLNARTFLEHLSQIHGWEFTGF